MVVVWYFKLEKKEKSFVLIKEPTLNFKVHLIWLIGRSEVIFILDTAQLLEENLNGNLETELLD